MPDLTDRRFTYARILVVDDEPSINVLGTVLQRLGITNIRGTSDLREVPTLFLEFDPDLVTVDLRLSERDDFGILTQLRSWIPADSYLPILVLTGNGDVPTKELALAAGATDFLPKPFDHTETVARVRSLLETRFMRLALAEQRIQVEESVRRRTAGLEEARLELLERLAIAAEYREANQTLDDARRVGINAGILARALELPPQTATLIRQAAPLHDIGKVGVPDAVLLKSGRLSEDELEIVRQHTIIGAQILTGSTVPMLQLAEQIALTHHERWDGSGYRGLEAGAIPLPSRIIAVIDVFDALTHERPYKPAWPVEQALAEIERGIGHQFDPDVATTFLQLAREGNVVP
ncbi:MAG: response regulator [Actinomycetota bacterium]|nr:response regulator [Actinomycetota bacterium]